ncbi:MAG: DUF1934 domain-containing protein [Oscillospiraceae bacterium]|jgi:uncharacterized beta-barrel protein YwiB (DUF1934 family)|nr:DUF1934 domain-containing protein [Oscillospiraceae bacterium]
MKENYLITIEGNITMDGDTDSVSLTTLGSYQMKNGKYYIVYKETEATGFAGCTTTLKAWDDGVSMTRFGGEGSSNLLIEKGAINLCNYQTMAGPIMLDINGIDIINNLGEHGGQLTFEYSLNAGGMLVSDNKVNVIVKEIN